MSAPGPDSGSTGAGDPAEGAGSDGARRPCLFVYGTLMPGRLRWPLLAPSVAQHRPALVPGALFDSGRGWPVAVFAGGEPAHGAVPSATTAPGEIPGHLVHLLGHRADEVLHLLDRVEGTETGLLMRIVVTTTDGTDAWAYHHPHPVAGLTPIADWAAVPPSVES